MQINSLKRPWRKQGRNNRNPFYRSREWRDIRLRHIHNVTTLPDGTLLDNKYCIECFRRTGRRIPMHTVDHIVAILDGGDARDPNNLQSLCASCHARKSSIEGQKRYENKGYTPKA